jgi:hypothetical protein
MILYCEGCDIGEHYFYDGYILVLFLIGVTFIEIFLSYYLGFISSSTEVTKLQLELSISYYLATRLACIFFLL